MADVMVALSVVAWVVRRDEWVESWVGGMVGMMVGPWV